MYMHVLLLTLGLFVYLSTAAYTLLDDYGNTDSFFDQFEFFTGEDPTSGFVTYVDQATAEASGLISSNDEAVYIGVDNTAVTTTGRNSVRISSTNTYNQGLFILDLGHMPASACGSWPAFWLLGNGTWPDNGEIDIIEGVNSQAVDSMTLHTTDGCSINDSGFTGTLTTGNCYFDAAGQSNNAGCGINNVDASSYGTGFNGIGGGVYAVEWTDSGISIWFFGRDTGIPSDITDGAPNPTLWPEPPATFAGDCDFASHFMDMSIHLLLIPLTTDLDLRYHLLRPVGRRRLVLRRHLRPLDGSCNDYVGNNPTAFTDTYWSINGLQVYQDTAATKRNTPMAKHHRTNAAKRARSPPQPMRARRFGRDSLNYFA
ncbi:hypothetical protein N7510_002741 [Penicillium lagena]|uniref:uncharacterized protein n=1 Tax=Penicillium lagena TaxID=94218 RepID=UPI002540E27F|nr:uncharacterized protein N7510_002741 [Penicillium lagena]KAJ5618757.1 hypothetical protein N7510_002741 [Penicillium lagena]